MTKGISLENKLSKCQSVIHLKSWDQLPNGEYLRQIVEKSLAPWGPRIFGYHLIKLGALSAAVDIDDCTINHQVNLSLNEEVAHIIGKLGQLPLQSASVDTVFASFLLEFNANPYLVLREIDRVLVCGGHLILVGFNPLSPGFIGKILPKYQKELPWCGHFYLPSRIKDWLALLAYKVLDDKRILHHSMIGDLNKGAFIQRGLASWLPGSGSIYIIVAKKLASPLTPIREKRKITSSNWSSVPTAGKVSHKKHHQM